MSVYLEHLVEGFSNDMGVQDNVYPYPGSGELLKVDKDQQNLNLQPSHT